MTINKKITCAVKPVGSVYREKCCTDTDTKLAAAPGIVSKIHKRIRHHFVEVRVATISDLIKAPAEYSNGQHLDLSDIDKDLLDLSVARLFVEEKCAEGLFLNLKFFPPEIHPEIAKMLIETGYGAMVVKRAEEFSGLNKFEMMAWLIKYLEDGKYIKVEQLVELENDDLLKIVDAYSMLKIMAKNGWGEYILEAHRKGAKLKNYNQAEIIKLTVSYLLTKAVGELFPVRELLNALDKVEIVCPENKEEIKIDE